MFPLVYVTIVNPIRSDDTDRCLWPRELSLSRKTGRGILVDVVTSSRG